MLKIKINPERRAKLDALKRMIERTTDGTIMSWMEIEAASGVEMGINGNHSGRGLFRLAMAKAKREYEPLIGSGVRFSAPNNALSIVRLRDKRIGGAAKRSHRADTRIQSRHIEQLAPADREEVRLRSALRGALLSGTRGLARLASSKEPVTPLLPANLSQQGKR